MRQIKLIFFFKDIEYIEMKNTAAFEESATIYHIDLHDGIRSFERGGPAVTLAKKVGQVGHKLTFGLLNRHHIAGWAPHADEHLAFAFVCTDAKKNQKLRKCFNKYILSFKLYETWEIVFAKNNIEWA